MADKIDWETWLRKCVEMAIGVYHRECGRGPDFYEVAGIVRIIKKAVDDEMAERMMMGEIVSFSDDTKAKAEEWINKALRSDKGDKNG